MNGDDYGRSDAELLRSYRTTRSEQIFKEIVERHGAFVIRVCLRVTGNPHDAEDAAQSVFLTLAQRPPAVTQSLSTWLHGVAVGSALNLVRGRSRRVRREKEAAERLKSSLNGTMLPEEDGVVREIDGALTTLPTQLREAVVLCHIQGLTQQEAARVVKCSVGTLGWRVMEGLNRLRGVLTRRGVVASSGALTLILAREAKSAVPPQALAHLADGVGRHGIRVLRVAKSTAVKAKVFHASAGAGAKAALAFAYVAALAAAVPLVVLFTQAPAPIPARNATVVQFPTAITPVAPPLEADPTERFGRFSLMRNIGKIPGGVQCVALSPDESKFAVGSGNGLIRVYDAQKQELQFELVGHEGNVNSLTFIRNGTMLASGCLDSTVRFWDLTTRTELKTLRGHGTSDSPGVSCVAVSPDGSTVASSGWDGVVKMWDSYTGSEVLKLNWRTNGCKTVQFSPDGKWLAASSNEGCIEVFDAKTGAITANLVHRSEHDCCTLAFSRGGSLLASGGADGRIKLWSVPGWKLTREMAAGNGNIICLLFSHDDVALFSGNERSRVVVLDVRTGSTLQTIEGHRNGVPGLALSNDERTLISGGYDGNVNIWSISKDTRQTVNGVDVGNTF